MVLVLVLASHAVAALVFVYARTRTRWVCVECSERTAPLACGWSTETVGPLAVRPALARWLYAMLACG